MQKSIGIVCQKNDNTLAQINVPIDTLVHSGLLNNIYNDMHQPETFDFINNIVTYDYLAIVCDIINGNLPKLNNVPFNDFLKLLNVIDYLIIDDKINSTLSQLMAQKAAEYANIELTTLILNLNECYFCRYIEQFILRLFECKSDDIIQFVKNNQIYNYSAIFIGDVRIKPLLCERIISYYTNIICKHFRKYILPSHTSNVNNIIAQTINGRKGKNKELHI